MIANDASLNDDDTTKTILEENFSALTYYIDM